MRKKYISLAYKIYANSETASKYANDKTCKLLHTSYWVGYPRTCTYCFERTLTIR